MMDADLLFHCDVIHELSLPETDDYSQLTKTVKSAEATRLQFMQWASWSWVEPLRLAVGKLCDLGAIGRMGICVELPSIVLEQVALDDSRVAVQDAMSEFAFKFCAELVTARASSQIAYTCGFPHLLAGLLSEKEDVVSNTFETLRERVLAWEEALVGPPTVERIASRSFLNSRFMRAVVFFARGAGWVMSAPLQSLLETVFSSLLNEKLIEDGAQKIRDDESRAAASKDMQRMQVGQFPIGHKLLESYERKEIKTTTSLPAPREVPASMFQPIVAPPTPRRSSTWSASRRIKIGGHSTPRPCETSSPTRS